MAGCVTGMLYPWEFRVQQTFGYFPPPYPTLSLTGRFLPSPALLVVENALAGVASVGIFCPLLVTPWFLLARWRFLSRPSCFRSSEISPASVASMGFFFLFPATYAAFPGMLAGSLPSPALPVIGNAPGIRGNFSHIPGRRQSTSVTTLPHQHPLPRHWFTLPPHYLAPALFVTRLGCPAGSGENRTSRTAAVSRPIIVDLASAKNRHQGFPPPLHRCLQL